MSAYDAVLLVSFGGPEKPEDVMPFLENVVRGRNVPRERLLEVAEHYHHFDGRSPINDQNRALIAALRAELDGHGLSGLPIYWGNRNWHPFLADTIGQMQADGVRKALAFVTSAFSSYSGCRQYRENIAAAKGELPMEINKLRVFYDHPAYLEVIREEAWDAWYALPGELRGEARFLFTAHSIPVSMAKGCRYEQQLQASASRVAAALGIGPEQWSLVYQSRSGPPSVPWLEPDILDALRRHKAQGTRAVVIVPIGFVSDHMEVLYDLDYEARQLCEELGIAMTRAATAGTHPMFVRTIRELIVERMEGGGVRPDLCSVDCCLPGGGPPRR